MDWNPGQALFGGRYIIEGKLGEGGIGITYLAKTQSHQLRVIKTLKEEILNNRSWKPHRDKLRQDFRDEAVRLAVCRHPHVVQIENIFDEENLPCMVMEYIQGEDLGKRLRRTGIVSETEALLYINQIGDALTVIHRKGLLHRDIKPRNIMIRTGKLEAVLIDFGIAREFIPGIVQRHTVYRTPGFAPPEQYQLEAIRGEYIDVYGLAATLYTLLTGVVPTSADDRLRNVPLETPLKFNPSISAGVNLAILQGMEMRSQFRPQSVAEWLSLLSSGIDEISSVPPTIIPSVQANIPTTIISQPIPPTHISPRVIPPQQNWKYYSGQSGKQSFSPEAYRTLQGHRSMVYAVAISPSGEFFVSGGNDNTVKLWKLQTGEKLRQLGRWFSGHNDSVWTLAFNHDGEILASGSWDNSIKLWQFHTGKIICTLTVHCHSVNALAFSPDGQLLASGSADCIIKITQVNTGNEINTFAGHEDAINSLAFSPDGQLLASASSDCTIKVWQVNTGQEIYTLSGHRFFVNCLLFNREGEVIISSSSDKTIKFWNVITGKEIRTLTGHTDVVSSISLSQNSDILVSGSWDKTIKVWHVETGTEICTLTGHENYIRSVAISPDGKTIVSAGDDNLIKIWR
ncbi:serine/threonine-protein kinase [Calothrix sp. UHCC 0171]|uniref:serine/threonine-protein kinase n=1 Tax=Calothrix sp. UHCC 0171 TaxID=3110245 RepID=UPI002B21643A|nr:serine/threonine-protein kinase [Calothrix sp. UHCC 0171]MEA5572407.1 serine/threonine-protein kinase [Calothrix sp. UHCC 0171]